MGRISKYRNRFLILFTFGFLISFGHVPGVFNDRAYAQTESAEIVFWRSVEKMETLEGYMAYLDKYPDGEFAPLAAVKIKSLIPTSPQTQQPKSNQPAVDASRGKSVEIGSIPGKYKMKLFWKKGEYSSYHVDSLTCETYITVRNDLKVPETKITCPSTRGPDSPWYYRGEVQDTGKVEKFKVWHAYGLGEYYLKGNVQKMQSNRKSKSAWNLFVEMTKEQ